MDFEKLCKLCDDIVGLIVVFCIVGMAFTALVSIVVFAS